jgi:bis(5'-nucleosyl)-tetraphosphatase (symmetrical)
MTTYAIGDLQGCYDDLMHLLENLHFESASDTLWFVGDLVNRGPKSLDTLRFVRDLSDAAITVLGNHDLHLLALEAGKRPPKKKDTLHEIFDAPDCDELLHWLRHRPLIHYDRDRQQVLVHAGLPPQWKAKKAVQYAAEVETILRSDQHRELFHNMYGDEPTMWDRELAGWPRIRFIINALTRMRYCSPDGRLNLNEKLQPGTQPKGLIPWFEVPERRSKNKEIIFGHWSTLGLVKRKGIIALDTGCVWGGRLTAVNLDDPQRSIYSCDCAGALRPGA